MSDRNENAEPPRDGPPQEQFGEEKPGERSRTRLIAAGLGGSLLIIAVIVAVVVSSGGESTRQAADDPESADSPALATALAIAEGSPAQLKDATQTAGCKLNENRNEGSNHKDASETFEYAANPPTSGDHTQSWAQDGAYSSAEWSSPYLVHALEHGRIIYQWNPDQMNEQQLGSMKKLYDDDPYHLLLTPNDTAMPYAIAATAWDRSLTCETMNDDVYAALRLFRLNHIDQAPEQVP